MPDSPRTPLSDSDPDGSTDLGRSTDLGGTTDPVGFSQPPLQISDATDVPAERMALARGEVSRTVQHARDRRQPGEPPISVREWTDDEVAAAKTLSIQGTDFLHVGGSGYLGFEVEGEGYRVFPVQGPAVEDLHGVRDLDDETAEMLESATVRSSLNRALFAATMREAGRPVADAYGALMMHDVDRGLPYETSQLLAMYDVRQAYAPASEALTLQRAGGRPSRFTARELVTMDIPEPEWLVEGVIPEGVTILAGKPKLGKSRFCRNVAVALAAGGKALGGVSVARCDVLYLHLEGGIGGLRKDVLTLCGGRPDEVPTGLAFETDWPRGPKGVEALGRYFEANEACRLVVIDTLKLFRTDPTGRGSMYDEDYAATVAISKVCQRWGVNTLLVHHASKRAAEGVEDVLDLISGSTGLVAGVDNGAVLAKTSQGVVLAVRPRDLEGVDLALEWDEGLSTWRVMGDAAVHGASEQQKKIYETIRDSREPLAPYEIAQIAEIEAGSVRQQLYRMSQKTPALVEKQGKTWVLATRPLSEQEARQWELDGALPPGVTTSGDDDPDAPSDTPTPF